MSFEKYPAYKDSGVEWLGDVPSHWSVTPLKWLAEQITDKANTSDFQVGLENIQGWTGRLIETDSEFSGDGIAFRSGDILFGKLRPYLAKVWFSDRSGQAVGDFFVLRPSSVKGEFLHKYILTPTVINDLNASTIGAKMPRVGWEDMAALAVTLPTPHEQTQIACFLDHETARIDALIEEQQRLIELLKEKRQAVVSHAVTKGLDPTVPMKDSGVEWLGEVPEHWEVKRLKHLCADIKAGPFGSALTKDMYVASGYKIYGQEQVIPSDFSIGDYYIDDERFESLRQYQILPEDILISCVGTFGKISVVPEIYEPGIMNPRLIRVRANHHATPQYLSTVLRSSVVFEQFAVLSRGGTMDVINIGTLSEIVLAVPPMNEQVAILSFIEEQLRRFDGLMLEASGGVRLLQERRSALISAAVTGKIDVRNWQPATADKPVYEPIPMAAEEPACYKVSSSSMA